MAYSQYVIYPLLLLCPLVLSRYDNFAFNNEKKIASSEVSSAAIDRITRQVPYSIPVNQAPILRHHIKKITATAGKTVRYIIPTDIFIDPEEGSNLTLALYEHENVPLNPAFWIQFIPNRRMIYGLPLKSHVSRWSFIVEAKDSGGLVARGPLDIKVKQHKSERTINHQFVMKIKLLKQFKNAIDWQIRTLEGILNLFRDQNIDNLTVLNVTQIGDVYEFAWANDTLPKYPTCAVDDINRVMKIMESDTNPGSPSSDLVSAMSPDLEVLEIRWRGTGRCAFEPISTTGAPVSFPPLNRNQIDHLTATAGFLFISKVPDDTFFDVEDGGTRNLQLSLKFADGSDVPSNHWLQFDPRNQEFYGVPTPSDEGKKNYVLVATDSHNMSAYNSFTVDVEKAPTICSAIEFQITIEPSVNLVYNAGYKRRIIEKLAALFGKDKTNNIMIQSITDNPTRIVWYNTNLSFTVKVDVEELNRMIVVEGESRNLKITSLNIIPRGRCSDKNNV